MGVKAVSHRLKLCSEILTHTMRVVVSHYLREMLISVTCTMREIVSSQPARTGGNPTLVTQLGEWRILVKLPVVSLYVYLLSETGSQTNPESTIRRRVNESYSSEG